MREGRDEAPRPPPPSSSSSSSSSTPALRKVVLARRTTLSLAEPWTRCLWWRPFARATRTRTSSRWCTPRARRSSGPPRASVFRSRRTRGVRGCRRDASPGFRRGRGRGSGVRDVTLREGTRVRHRSRGGAPRVGGRRGGWSPRRSRRAREGRAPARLRATSLRAIGRAISARSIRGGRPRGVTPDARGVRPPARRRARRRAPRGDVRSGVIRRPDGLGRRRLCRIRRRDSIAWSNREATRYTCTPAWASSPPPTPPRSGANSISRRVRSRRSSRRPSSRRRSREPRVGGRPRRRTRRGRGEGFLRRPGRGARPSRSPPNDTPPRASWCAWTSVRWRSTRSASGKVPGARRGDHEFGHRRREFASRGGGGARVVRAAVAAHRRSPAGTPRHGREPDHRSDQNLRDVREVRGGSPAARGRRARARLRHRRRRRAAPPPRRQAGSRARQLPIPRSARPGRRRVESRAGPPRAQRVGARHRAAVSGGTSSAASRGSTATPLRVRVRNRNRRRRRRPPRGDGVFGELAALVRSARRGSSSLRAAATRRRARRRGDRRDARVGRRGGRGVGRSRPRTTSGGRRRLRRASMAPRAPRMRRPPRLPPRHPPRHPSSPRPASPPPSCRPRPPGARTWWTAWT